MPTFELWLKNSLLCFSWSNLTWTKASSASAVTPVFLCSHESNELSHESPANLAKKLCRPDWYLVSQMLTKTAFFFYIDKSHFRIQSSLLMTWKYSTVLIAEAEWRSVKKKSNHTHGLPISFPLVHPQQETNKYADDTSGENEWMECRNIKSVWKAASPIGRSHHSHDKDKYEKILITLCWLFSRASSSSSSSIRALIPDRWWSPGC